MKRSSLRSMTSRAGRLATMASNAAWIGATLAMSSYPMSLSVGVPEGSTSVSHAAKKSKLSTCLSISAPVSPGRGGCLPRVWTPPLPKAHGLRQALLWKELVAERESLRCDLELSDSRIVSAAARLEDGDSAFHLGVSPQELQ